LRILKDSGGFLWFFVVHFEDSEEYSRISEDFEDSFVPQLEILENCKGSWSILEEFYEF